MELPVDPSAWRRFTKPSASGRPVSRLRKHPQLNMFYGYPAGLIAEWCGRRALNRLRLQALAPDARKVRIQTLPSPP